MFFPNAKCWGDYAKGEINLGIGCCRLSHLTCTPPPLLKCAKNRRAGMLSGLSTNQRTISAKRTKRSLRRWPDELNSILCMPDVDVYQYHCALWMLKIDGGIYSQSFKINVVEAVFSESLGPITDRIIDKSWFRSTVIECYTCALNTLN